MSRRFSAARAENKPLARQRPPRRVYREWVHHGGMCGRPPSCKVFQHRVGDLAACGHVSGLSVRSLTAGPDGFRGSAPKHGSGVEARIPPYGVVPILGSTDCHLCCCLASSVGGENALRRRRASIGLAVHHDGPSDAGDLVGERNRDQLARLARQEREKPGRGMTWLGPSDDRCGADDEQGSQGLVALSADLAEPLLASR